ncbi:hypothetical protein O987_03865 [Comamonas testosteroni TK102]|uniref:Uncharacterized protein n=1 Tax=Comamonas testosteroni TK102 TaxID=1392005 RepID=A0A076PNN4_COMTE|nr:hypothetical protein O987_03865 [Comamonas testosteroni TK102]
MVCTEAAACRDKVFQEEVARAEFMPPTLPSIDLYCQPQRQWIWMSTDTWGRASVLLVLAFICAA